MYDSNNYPEEMLDLQDDKDDETQKELDEIIESMPTDDALDEDDELPDDDDEDDELPN